MSIVVDQDQTEHVLKGPDGVLAALRPGSTIIVIEHARTGLRPSVGRGTGDHTHRVDRLPGERGPDGAEKGTLALIAGGGPEVIERCRPPLEIMGTINYCGPTGMGMVAKLANNSVALLTVPLIQEARAMAASYGVDMETLMSVMSNGTANSFIVQSRKWAEEYGEKGALVALKDLRLYQQAAAVKSVPTLMLDTHLAKERVQTAVNTKSS